MHAPETPSVLVAAEEYLKRGWQPIPIPQGKKAPHLENWPQLRLRMVDLAAKFRNGGNIGVLLGDVSGGLVDIDLDVSEALVVADSLLPVTHRIHGRTSKPRSHRWYICNQLPRPEKFTDIAGTCLVEVRSTGQQTVVPPSTHPSAELLCWEQEGDPAIVDRIHLRRDVARVAAATLLARHWPCRGRRHEAALALHGVLLRARWAEAQAEHFVRAVALAARDEEWASRGADARTTTERLADKGRTTGRPRLSEIVGAEVVDRVSAWLELAQSDSDVENIGPALTDLGNAKRFALVHGKEVRFCHPWRKWLVWNGKRWMKDDTGEIRRRAKRTALDILLEVAAEADYEKRKKLVVWQKQSEFEHRIRALISLAESEPGIPVLAQELDHTPMLLNCQNGTLDLTTGRFREPHREDLITKLTPVEYDEKARCPHWLEFLNRIIAGNRELISFLQRVAGYSLTGDTREHVLFIFWGSGANGKTTFIETLRHVWGDYATSAEFSSFVAARGTGVRNDLARLAGARAVTAVESQANRPLAEEVIKQITGGDTITARYLYSEHFEFRPQFKLFLATNHKPRIRGTDHAIWRRIHLVPFTVTIPQEEQDKTLLEKLRGEAPGILRWAFEGLLAWKRQGLAAPAAVADATSEYRCEQDVLQHFLDEQCVADPGTEMLAADLYAGYKAWCEAAGESPLCKRDLGLALQDRGFQRTRSGTSRKWAGVRLSKGCS